MKKKTILLLLILNSIIATQSFTQQSIAFDWEKDINMTYSFERISAQETDKFGNIYIIGGFSDSLSIQGITYISPPHKLNSFILKLNPSGDLLWSKHFLSNYDCRPFDVAIDSNNNVYFLGGYINTVSFDTTLTSNNAIPNEASHTFLAKYDSNGQLIWADSYGGIYSSLYHALEIDHNNDIIMSGMSIDLTLFDADTTVYTLDSTWVLGPWGGEKVYFQDEYSYLTKYDQNGQQKWIKTIATDSFSFHGLRYGPKELIVDSNNDIIITGTFTNGDSTYFDSISVITTGTQTAFICKTNSSGVVQWAHTAGGAHNYNLGQEVVVDSLNNIYQTGYLGGANLSFGDSIVTTHFNNGSHCMFLAKYSSTGVFQWLRIINDQTDSDASTGTALEIINGHLLLFGHYKGTFESCIGFSTSTDQMILLHVDWDGTIFRCMEYSNFSYASQMAIGLNQDILISGFWQGSPKIGKIGTPNSVKNISKVESNFLVYPNPNYGTLTFEFKEENSDEKHISIYAADGRFLESFKKMGSLFSIKTKHKGLLLFTVYSNNKLITKKIIVN